MAEQYSIGGFFIDLSRNQITQNNQSQIIAPKALAVLTYLAENQGKVVSHDALLENVWQGTVVSPNTLQRSIAQLRKALGDDGKVQVYIKTHAKQGYSLECDVRWHDNIESPPLNAAQENIVDTMTISETNALAMSEDNTQSKAQHHSHDKDQRKSATTTDNAKPSKLTVMPLFTLFGIIILAYIGYQYLMPQPPSKLSFGELRLLTTTDNKEFASIYSPDGQYVVFHRYSEVFCRNNIWAKNTKTQQETQLTKDFDSYGSHSFSTDGNQLVFIQTGGCSKPEPDNQCYKLMSLDFHKALQAPQSAKVLVECKNSEIKFPKWLNNDDIALFQKLSNRWKLTRYSVSENKTTDIYEIDEGNLIYYDYSPEDELLAVISSHKDGQYYIEILKPDGRLISSNRIEYPKEIAKFKRIYPNFSPLKEQLIFSTGRQLFTLSFDGQVTNISLPLDQPMGQPQFHPDGKRMLVIKGHYDSDIASIPFSQLLNSQLVSSPSNTAQIENAQIVQSSAQTQSLTSSDYSVIERSTYGEDSAKLQPNGELIAYLSDRSGEEQLWITDGKSSQQLTDFPMDTYIYGMDWAADGQSLLVNANDVLIQVSLDSTQTIFPLEYPVFQLFQWDSKNNRAVVLIRIQEVLTFAELNLTHLETRTINDKDINWALKSENGQLVYADKMGRFWRPGSVEDQRIEALDGQEAEKQRFVINDNVIYGINKQNQLWSYGLNEDKFDILADLPSNVDYLTDIDNSQLLMSIRVSARKDVAELTIKQ